MRFKEFLIETTDKYVVFVHHNKRVLFYGSREDCIRFIQRWDEAHSTYTDLRVRKPDGTEDTFWETKPSLQRKYKGVE